MECRECEWGKIWDNSACGGLGIGVGMKLTKGLGVLGVNGKVDDGLPESEVVKYSSICCTGWQDSSVVGSRKGTY